MKRQAEKTRSSGKSTAKQVTQSQVIQSLTSPRAPRITKLGVGALPHLRKLAEGQDLRLATKAIYAAGVVGGDDAEEIIQQAAKSRKPMVRVVSAAAAAMLSPEKAERILKPLQKSADAGIKKWARKSAAAEKKDKAVATTVRKVKKTAARSAKGKMTKNRKAAKRS